MLISPTAVLLDEVNSFLNRVGMAPTQFGKDAIGDPNLVRHLRAGRDPRLSTAQRVRDFMVQYEADVSA